MNLRHIEIFHAVYVSGSISAAARALGVSQPSVSKTLRHAEIGAGSGYLIAALIDAGATQAVGYEVSEAQVEYARSMLGPGRVLRSPNEDVGSLLRGLDCQAVSMIFSLEHVSDPGDVLQSLTQNPHIDYFYFAVPMLSASALMDSV